MHPVQRGPELPLAHLLALDLAVAALAHNSEPDEPSIVIAPSQPIADEAVARYPVQPDVLNEGAADLEERRLRAALPGATPDLHPARLASALWIAPQHSTWRAQARDLDALLRPGGVVAVIGGGPLAVLLARLRPEGAGFSRGAVHIGDVARLLGYSTVGRWWLYGPRSAGWGCLRIAVERLGRPDLVDRFEAAFQSSLVETTKPGLWSIGLWVGRKPAEQ